MGDLVLPAGTKMRLLGEAQRRLANLDFRVLFVLHERADRSTGTVEISHGELAAEVRCQRRAAEKATTRLIASGDIKVERQQIGQRADGSPVYGGKGRRNRYRLIFERPSIGTVFEGERPSVETVNKDRPATPERPSGDAGKTVPVDVIHYP